MDERSRPTFASSNPLSAVVLLEGLDGRTVGAGLLLTWGGGPAVQVALCTAGASLRNHADLKIALPPIDGRARQNVGLAEVAVGSPVDAASSAISVLRLKREPFAGRAWAFGKLARSPMVSVDGLQVGSIAFLPALSDAADLPLSRPLLLERSFAGRDGQRLLINAPLGPFPLGTPVFVRRPSWPRVSGVGLHLCGILVQGADGDMGLCRMAHVSELLTDQARWKPAATTDKGQSGWALEELHPLIAAFLVEAVATGRFSRATLKARRHDLSMLDRWAREAQLDAASLSEEQLRQYFQFRQDEGRSPLTLIRARSSVDRFMAYLVQRGARGNVPSAKVELVEADLRLKLVLGDRAARALLDRPDRSTAIGRRDRAILEVLYATAIKPHELVSLKIDDFDLKAGKLHLDARRYGDIVLTLNGRALGALRAHFLELNRYGAAAPTDLVFRTAKGLPLHYARVGDIVRRHAISAGFDERVTGSTLRNSAAHHLLRRGVDRKALAAFLGIRDTVDLDGYVTLPKLKQSRA